MSLSPEERRKIYEEEKVKLEAEQKTNQERTLTSLKPGAAGLLCYLGGWITGIVFLVLEQKDRFVRFHAAQSILVFGFLNIVFLLLRPVPFIGTFFGTIIGVLAFVLWIVLMVKAGQGELFKLPVAGDLADKLIGQAPAQPTRPSLSSEPQTSPGPVQASAASSPPAPTAVTRDGHAGRAARIATSAFVIAWSVALLVFLNFFHDYIAYYHLETVGGVSHWVREPIVTSDFGLWLPVLNTVLALTIAGHIMLLAIDKYIVRESTQLVLDVLGIVSVTALLSIFPFDFQPFAELAGPLDLSAHITLVVIVFGMAIGVLVRFIKIIVNVAKGTATY
jgi:uncharacterized membrane protein